MISDLLKVSNNGTRTTFIDIYILNFEQLFTFPLANVVVTSLHETKTNKNILAYTCGPTTKKTEATICHGCFGKLLF